MLLRTAAARRPPRWAALLGLLPALAGCSPEHYPQTTLLPLSDFARIGDNIQDTTLYWAFGVFVLVEGALLYAIFRYRGRPNDAEPVQTHGNTVVEIIWTVIPALILAVIAVPTVQGIFQTSAKPEGESVEIEVVGHQWWWEFRYPKYNITTANELHIPVGQTVSIVEHSGDVVHSFWPPRFAGKRDVFPNRPTRLWFKAERAGEYPGQCAEFCGIQHARMAFRVKAQPAAEFAAWLRHMQTLGSTGPTGHAASAAPANAATASVAPADSALRTASAGARVAQGQENKSRTAPPDPKQGAAPATPARSPLYAQGEKLFTSKGCLACHSLSAYKAPQGMVGPNLANVGSRSYIAAGTLKNTDANLARWIRNPQAIKEGVVMPNLGVTEAEAKALVAFLRAHQ